MIHKDIKKILKEYFFTYPTAKLRVREMERKLKLPLPSVIRYCKELRQQGILATEKIGDVTFYTASRSNTYLLEKKLFNIRSVYDSGLIEYLKQELSNPVIILFGSYAKGEDTEDSDIDLYIETPSKKQVDLEKFKRLLHREIQVFKNRSIKDIPNHHLANNIVNGITLNNYLEVFT